MEIEKKYLVCRTPEHLEGYDHSRMEQGYLNQKPVMRIRKTDEEYCFTYKSKREAACADPVCINHEVELPLSREAYEHLREKIDGCMIEKTRYRIPDGPYTIELDVFHGKYEGMILAEVEFPTEQEAQAYVPPDWFGENVSSDYRYTNASLALTGLSGFL